MQSHRIHQINNIFNLPCSQSHKCSLSRLCVRLRHHGCFSRRPSLLSDNFKISLSQKSPLVYKHRKYRAFDEDSFGVASFDEWGYDEGTYGYILSSSDDEECEGEIVLTPISDLDLPTSKLTTDDALTITAHRFGMLGRGSKKHRIRHGFLINMALIIFLTMLLLYVDWCAWRIVRLPLESFYLTRPFFISAALAACTGYICVPLLKSLDIHQIIRRRPIRHYKKRQTPTMGGLFLIPAGVAVAKFLARHSSKEVSGAAAATLAFALIGVLDDLLGLRNHNRGLPAWIKITLEAAVGICFSLWVDSTSMASPYGMKLLIPLPTSLGLVCIGKFHLLLTPFCFISMGSGMNSTDGLDGLAGGTAALAFIGMSIAVLPICSDLAIFGASMGGACLGFLLHNRYRASVFMGDTGSLALGGALAAMAACSGMFFPLFISSGIFIVEVLSVILQIIYFKTTKYLWGAGHRLFRMAPVHYHLELCGIREPIIVAVTYVIGGMLSLLAGYVGLISA